MDQGGDQVTEINGAGVWQHSNVFSAARLTATYDKLGLHYELADPLGTKRMQANTTDLSKSGMLQPALRRCADADSQSGLHR